MTRRFTLFNVDLEMLSEAIKILKGELCLSAIEKFKMDRALIFCRTKLDCDNLERYFIRQGGGKTKRKIFSVNDFDGFVFLGPKSNKHKLSCVCLHSDRSPDERQRNLERFKSNDVRFLICTDVAARGIDVRGLPFGELKIMRFFRDSYFLLKYRTVINMTLPDEKESYIHRIGRVGRAER